MTTATADFTKRLDQTADDTEALRRHLEPRTIEATEGRVLLDGEDVTAAIRTPAIDKATSDLSRLAVVRDKVATVAGHPALLCYAIGNEIAAPKSTGRRLRDGEW
jgi:cytidylate kinase